MSSTRSPSESPFGPELQKYWNRRYEYFSKFDDGIAIDAEGLYSVMPEDAAFAQAKKFAGSVVLDAFCGVGGSAIGLARAGKTVIAIDIDPQRIEMARHNAKIYGVADQISFITGDFLQLIDATEADAVNLDPPWGGPNYRDRGAFLLEDFEPDGRDLLRLCFKRFPEVMLRVPRSFDESELDHIEAEYSHFPDYSHDRLISSSYLFTPKIRSS